jgi:dTDP-4-amino-4,6-dideoxygalactose transaminase
MLRDHGSEKRYYHDMVGWNARLDELQAAALRIKLPHLDRWNDQRRLNASLYKDALNESNLILPQESANNRHVYHLYVIRSQYRDELRSWLNEHGIGTGIHYPVPIHLQPAYKNLGFPPESLPVTEKITQEILSLPMYPDLTPDQIMKVSGFIQELLIDKL